MTTVASAKPLSAVECIRPSVNRTESLMFPIRWARWWRIALLGLATGEFASQGGCSFNLPGDFSKLGKPGSNSRFPWPANIGISHAQIAALVTVLVAGIILLVFVHLYISSVARFMLFDAVATGRHRLREGWSRWQSHGFRYFLFQLAFGACVLGMYIILVGFPALIAWQAGMFHNFKDHWVSFLVALIFLLPIFMACSLALALFGLFVKDFAVPIIALEDITIPDALRKLWEMVKTAKGDFTIYVLMKIAMSVGIGIGLAIIDFIVTLVLAVPVVIILVAAIAANPRMFQDPVTIALMITLAVLCVIPFLFVIGFIAAPAVVFYQSYVLNFFGSRYAPLWAFMHPEGMPGQTPMVPPLTHEPPPYDIIPPEPTS